MMSKQMRLGGRCLAHGWFFVGFDFTAGWQYARKANGGYRRIAVLTDRIVYRGVW